MSFIKSAKTVVKSGQAYGPWSFSRSETDAANFKTSTNCQQFLWVELEMFQVLKRKNIQIQE